MTQDAIHHGSMGAESEPPGADSVAADSADLGFDQITRRLNRLLGNQTYAEIGRRTGCNSETVRRYMQGGVPSVYFVREVARRYEVSLDWLLLGNGPEPLLGSDGAAAGRQHRLRRAAPQSSSGSGVENGRSVVVMRSAVGAELHERPSH